MGSCGKDSNIICHLDTMQRTNLVKMIYTENYNLRSESKVCHFMLSNRYKCCPLIFSLVQEEYLRYSIRTKLQGQSDFEVVLRFTFDSLFLIGEEHCQSENKRLGMKAAAVGLYSYNKVQYSIIQYLIDQSLELFGQVWENIVVITTTTRHHGLPINKIIMINNYKLLSQSTYMVIYSDEGRL